MRTFLALARQRLDSTFRKVRQTWASQSIEQAELAYLNDAKDIYDVEYRIRELAKARSYAATHNGFAGLH